MKLSRLLVLSLLLLLWAAVFLVGCSHDEEFDRREKGRTLCTNVDPSACIGAPSNWPPDDELRVAYAWKTACAQNVWPACTSLGFLYEEGRVVHAVPARALLLYDKACKGGDGAACLRLSRLYDRGVVGPPAPELAQEMRAKACANGELRGCPDGGTPGTRLRAFVADRDGAGLEAVLRTEAGAWRALAKRCSGGDGESCNNLGWKYQKRIGRVAKDGRRGFQLYARACELGYARGCDNLGWVYQNGIGVERSDKGAFGAYRKACDGNDANGCNNLGWLYRNGIGVKRDEVLAAPLFERACDADNKFGCANLAWLYYHGRGVAKSPLRAETYYQKSCRLGYREACDSVKRMARQLAP